MYTVQADVLARMRRGAGKIHISKDFLDLGNRVAIYTALFRLTERKAVRRIGRGLYHLPRTNPKLGIELVPDIDEVAQALDRRTGSRVVQSDAVADAGDVRDFSEAGGLHPAPRQRERQFHLVQPVGERERGGAAYEKLGREKHVQRTAGLCRAAEPAH